MPGWLFRHILSMGHVILLVLSYDACFVDITVLVILSIFVFS